MTDPKFVDQMAGLSNGRTMFVREMPADMDGDVVREVVMVGTDIAAPTPTAFSPRYMLDARDLDDTVDADSDGTATNRSIWV